MTIAIGQHENLINNEAKGAIICLDMSGPYCKM